MVASEVGGGMGVIFVSSSQVGGVLPGCRGHDVEMLTLSPISAVISAVSCPDLVCSWDV